MKKFLKKITVDREETEERKKNEKLGRLESYKDCIRRKFHWHKRVRVCAMSAQNTIVERASAELTKRINGLRKHGNSNSSSINSNNSLVGKTSVMERVTNVLCGGSSSNLHNNNNNSNANSTSVSITTPDKPYRYQSKHQHNNIFSQHNKMSGASVIASNQNSNSNSNQSTPQSLRKFHPKTAKRFVPLATPILSIEQLLFDERFLQLFFLYFSSYERRELALGKWLQLLTLGFELNFLFLSFFLKFVPNGEISFIETPFISLALCQFSNAVS